MPGAAGQLKKLYQQIVGGVATGAGANASGSLAEQVAYIAGQVGGGRYHVWAPHEWGLRVGTDYWLHAVNAGWGTAGNAHELPDYGWSYVGPTIQAPGNHIGDLFDQADTDDVAFDLNAASAVISSPPMFGGHWHGKLFESLNGNYPTKLVAEFAAAFPTNSANEIASAIGFAKGNGTVSSQKIAAIYSNGSNFVASGSGSDTGAAIDANTHLFRLELTAGGTCEWFIDGVSQGTFAYTNDNFPARFAAQTSTTNRIRLYWAHLWYE